MPRRDPVARTIASVLLASTLFVAPRMLARDEPVALTWLGDAAPAGATGVSWGVPWPQGATRKDEAFHLAGADGTALPALVQTWPLAYWPDGSIKWSGFAAVVDGQAAGPLRLTRGALPGARPVVLRVQTAADAIEVSTGPLKCRIPRRGDTLVDTLEVDGRVVARAGQLQTVIQDGPDGDVDSAPARTKYVGQIDDVTVEQSGPVRAVVRVRGHHATRGTKALLPFDLRLYFYAGQQTVRLVHTLVYDGDEQKDFIRGLGLRFGVPLREQVHNRYVRFGGEGDGLWSEPVKPLTGRRALMYQGHDVYPEQFAGKRVPNREEYDATGQALVDDWAQWDAYKLVQGTADGFTLQKRTNPESAWIDATAGRRASGLAFVGDVTGGLAVGVKDFWQSHPTSFEIRGATGAEAELRVWLWSPDAAAMDMRHYDTRSHGLEAAYEDVQPGFSTPFGVARTSELTLYPSAGLPAKDETVRAGLQSRQPALLVATPAYLHSVRAFGIWSLPDRTTPGKRWIEDQLDGSLAFYEKEVEQRRWYGFWNYGDVMHTYDRVRHVWRYDVGGFAWDNSELVPDMWLWYSFLRTARADVFRMAEAMTRHTGEVDVYHLGRFAGLGSRHNVRHWGCGSKEARISQAALRRFYHYLTTDERSGDLMHEVADADMTTLTLDPMRLAMPISQVPTQQAARARVGPDWLAFAGNWMTEWERTGNTAYRDRIVAGMDSVAAMRHGLFSGPGVLGYDPKSKRLFDESTTDSKHTSHLVAIMGGSEVMFELAQSLKHPGWEHAWLDYCRMYSAPEDGVGGGSFPQWHARLTAYAAKVKQDPQLAARAWTELLGRGGRRQRRASYVPKTIAPPEVLRPVEESLSSDTNDTAQWSLNAIEVLDLVGDQMPEHSPLWDEK
jgi:YetA-like protein